MTIFGAASVCKAGEASQSTESREAIVQKKSLAGCLHLISWHVISGNAEEPARRLLADGLFRWGLEHHRGEDHTGFSNTDLRPYEMLMMEMHY